MKTGMILLRALGCVFLSLGMIIGVVHPIIFGLIVIGLILIFWDILPRFVAYMLLGSTIFAGEIITAVFPEFRPEETTTTIVVIIVISFIALLFIFTGMVSTFSKPSRTS